MAKEVGPKEWAYLFEQAPGGRDVLEVLIRRFARPVFVKGDFPGDGDRRTAFNAGQRDVLDYILTQINIAHGVKDNPNE